MRKYYILLLGAISLLAACQKELSSDGLTTPSCKLEKIYYYNGSTPEDTVLYEYSGDKISKVIYNDVTTTVEYTGERITKKYYYNKGSTESFGFDQYTFNSDGTLSKADFYYTDPSQQAPYLIYENNFTWTGGKLATLVYKEDTTFDGTGPEPLIEYSYTYSGENIDRVVTLYLTDQTADTIYFSHDANLNYFSKMPELLLTDQIFFDMDGSLLALALSQNNVTEFTESAPPVPITYGENDQGNIKEFILNGSIFARYFYKCQ